jgi:hypothetical protein
VTAFQRFQRLPGTFQLAGAASILLIGGSLAPWINYGGDLSDLNFASGLDTNSGELSLLIGVFVIFLLVRMAKQGRTRDGGVIAALGLLACAVVAITAIRISGGEYSVGWGVWVSAAAAGVLLLAGLILFDTGQQLLPPPD